MAGVLGRCCTIFHIFCLNWYLASHPNLWNYTLKQLCKLFSEIHSKQLSLNVIQALVELVNINIVLDSVSVFFFLFFFQGKAWNSSRTKTHYSAPQDCQLYRHSLEKTLNNSSKFHFTTVMWGLTSRTVFSWRVIGKEKKKKSKTKAGFLSVSTSWS